MLVTLLLVAGVTAALWLFWRYRNRALLRAGEHFPGPKPLIGFGNSLKFICSPTEFIATLENWMANYGDVMRFWLGPDLNILVANPDEVKILLTNSKLSNKGPLYKYIGAFLGEGILSGSGPSWRKHRKISNPNYGKRAINNYTHIFNKDVDQMMDALRKRPAGKEFNMYEDVVRTATYSVCQTLLGLSKKETMSLPHLQKIIDGVDEIMSIAFNRMTRWYLQIEPVYWMTDYYKQQRNFNSLIQDFCTEILKLRQDVLRQKGIDGKLEHLEIKEDDSLSVIDRFLLSDELSTKELIHETFTVFVSSQETVAKMTCYVLLMMAFHPDCQEKLYNELISVIGDEDRDITEDDMKQMTYLDMVFKEVMRLFPPGAILQRTVSEDIAIKSGCIPAGSSLMVPIYFMQRDPRFWENPKVFDPERFSPENIEKGLPNAYIPFSLGPMDCIGRYYAYQIVKIISSRVLREFELSSTYAYKDLRLSIYISVASIDGYPIMLKPRKTNTK